MRDIIGPKMVFCKEYTLIIYPKKILKPTSLVSKDDNSSDNELLEDDLFNTNEPDIS